MSVTRVPVAELPTDADEWDDLDSNVVGIDEFDAWIFNQPPVAIVIEFPKR